MRPVLPSATLRRARPLWMLLVLLSVAGCGLWSRGPQPAPHYREARQILGNPKPTPRYYRERSRLEALGPGFDTVLVALASDRSARIVARSNALLLLADRHSPLALPALQRALSEEKDERLRSAAVTGLQRIARDSEAAVDAIREAVGDPSRRVRLSALLALGVQDVEVIRTLLAREHDPEVRTIAEQLLFVAESRGAPLAPDSIGVRRTTALPGVPQIIVYPATHPTASGDLSGYLWVEMPDGRRVQLAERVEVVGGVAPAFLSPNRRTIVYEADGGIWLHELKRRGALFLGDGIAPRPVPFTEDFVFFRQAPESQPVPAAETHYSVLRAPFAGGAPEVIGEFRALIPRTRADALLRQLLVVETPEGFVLRAEGLRDFPLGDSFGSPIPEDGIGDISLRAGVPGVGR